MFGAYVGVKVASGGFLTENDAIDSHATVAAATGGASLVAVWALTRPRLRPLAVMATPVAGLAVGYALAGCMVPPALRKAPSGWAAPALSSASLLSSSPSWSAGSRPAAPDTRPDGRVAGSPCSDLWDRPEAVMLRINQASCRRGASIVSRSA